MNTRERLVRATRESVRDVGLPATTAREITRRAEANLAAIPYHFGTKGALVTEALLAEARELVEPVLTVLGTDRPPMQRLVDAVAMLNDLFEDHRGAVPTYLAALASTPHSPEVRAGMERLWADVRGQVARDIDALRADHLVPEWVDPPAMAGLILGVVNGVIVASEADPRGPDHRAVAGQFLQLLAGASRS